MWGRVDTVEVFDKFLQVVGDQLGMINSWVILTTRDPFIFGNNSWTVYKCIGELRLSTTFGGSQIIFRQKKMLPALV